MSLATRCTSCGTVFRVVQDQLKVSEGWVRCGRCHEVFNALEGLFDLERDGPPEWAESKQMTPVSMPEHRPLADEREHEEAPDPFLVDRIDEQLFSSTTRRTGFGALTGLGGPDRGRGPDFADARFDTDVPLDSVDEGSTLPAQAATAIEPSPEKESLVHAPTFVREADRAARWQSSGWRRALIALLLLLTGVLALQAAHHFRNALAARYVSAAPAFTAWCRWIGCTIEAPRRLDDIVVESTALTKAPSAEAYRFDVTLHNRGRVAAALPWLELTLTDANGALLARRALGPVDLRARTREIGAGAEASLRALLDANGLHVTGYTVEIFYP